GCSAYAPPVRTLQFVLLSADDGHRNTSELVLWHAVLRAPFPTLPRSYSICKPNLSRAARQHTADRFPAAPSGGMDRNHRRYQHFRPTQCRAISNTTFGFLLHRQHCAWYLYL